MKVGEVALAGGLVMGIVAVVLVVAIAMRWTSNVTSSVRVHQVEPGVRCAVVTTSDGVGIDCWRKD